MTLWRRPVSGIVTKIRKDAVARSPGAERTNGADCSLAPGPGTLAATPPSPRRPGAPTTGVEAPVGRRQPAGDGAERWLRRCGHPVQQGLPTGPPPRTLTARASTTSVCKKLSLFGAGGGARAPSTGERRPSPAGTAPNPGRRPRPGADAARAKCRRPRRTPRRGRASSRHNCRQTGPGPRVGRRQGLADADSGAECARVALKLEPVEPSLR